MDDPDRALLARLIRDERIAALGTLRQGAPLVSTVLFLPAADCAAFHRAEFHLHVSRLAWHTQDMTADPRVSLCIAQTDDGREDAQTLARLSIRGDVVQLPNAGAQYDRLKAGWLARHPASAINFQLADFHFWRLAPRDARFVAGFGRIHNLSAQDLHA
jgi:hypothetical protein